MVAKIPLVDFDRMVRTMPFGKTRQRLTALLELKESVEQLREEFQITAEGRAALDEPE